MIPVGEALGRAAGKVKQATADVQRRREICSRCPHQTPTTIKTCELCRCPIVFVTLTAGECRLNKW